VYEQVVEQIQAFIRDGELAPGDQLLPERQLAEQLGVSRSALREALSVLVSQGLIEITPGGGAYVREMTVDDLVDPLTAVVLKDSQSIYDLLEARGILEVGAARLAAQRADADDLHHIRKAAVEMNSAFRSGATSAAAAADVAFHAAIVHSAHNSVLENVMAIVSSLMHEVYDEARIRLVEDPERMEYYCASHLEIYEAIREGDANGSAELLATYIEAARNQLKDIQALPPQQPAPDESA
jgi:GntR family transcriptional repressor for pyruvate dehydrogenase complex